LVIFEATPAVPTSARFESKWARDTHNVGWSSNFNRLTNVTGWHRRETSRGDTGNHRIYTVDLHARRVHGLRGEGIQYVLMERPLHAPEILAIHRVNLAVVDEIAAPDMLKLRSRPQGHVAHG
jgi:hypothetical protein